MKATTIGMMMLVLTSVGGLADNHLENSVQLCTDESGGYLTNCLTIVDYDRRTKTCWIRGNVVADSEGNAYRDEVLQVMAMGINYCTTTSGENQ